MNKSQVKCVKVEVLEVNGKPNGVWTEYWSPCFNHPYNTDRKDEFVKACEGGDGDSEMMSIANPSIGKLGHWLNDDIGFLTDRMTANIATSNEWKRCRKELADAIENCTEVNEVTIKGDDGMSAKFRLTPIDHIEIPLKEYDKEWKWDELAQKDVGTKMFCFTDKAYEMIVEAVKAANE